MQNGAGVNAKKKYHRDRPLHIVCKYVINCDGGMDEFMEVVRVLINNKGANLKEKNNGDKTPAEMLREMGLRI